MKSIKDLREHYDLIIEKEEHDMNKLTQLVRAGLYDAKKLPALKKALEKSVDKMTAQEKRMLINLLDSLINQVVSSDQVYRKVKQNVEQLKEMRDDYYGKTDPRFKYNWPSDKQIPSVIILKRKAIRVYPDNQKVALYHSQALDKYVTIPFSDIHVGEVNEAVTPKPSDKDDDEKKKSPSHNADEYFKNKIKKSTTDALNRVYKKGEYAPVKRFANMQKKYGTGGAIGIAINDLFKRRAIKARVNAKRKIIAANKAAATATPTSVTESFKRNLDNARQVNEIAPVLAALGVAGRAALPILARGARTALPYAARAVKAVGGKAKGLGKKILNKFKGKKAAIAASALSGDEDSSSSRSSTTTTTQQQSASREYGLGALKPTTGSSWQNRADSQASQRARDLQLSRRSQAAVMGEETVLKTLKNIAESDVLEATINFDEQEININNTVAKKILAVYEAVNSNNKKKMEKMLNESAESFNKVLTFAIRQ